MKKLVFFMILASQTLVANDSSTVQSLMAGLDTNSLPYLEASCWLAGIDETERLPYASTLALQGHIEENPYLSYVSKEKLAQATGGKFIRQPWPLDIHEEKNNSNENIHRRERQESLVVYPNPTSRKLTVEIRRKIVEGHVRILNSTGVVVFTRQVHPGELIVFIELDHLTPGFYIVQHIDKQGSVVSAKLIKQ